MKEYKLGVTYSLFCGEEMLKNSILSIRENVDYINIVWQEYSWTGEKASDNISDLLEELVKEGLINKIIKYTFNLKKCSKKSRSYQCQKKNLGIRDLRKAGCTHAMIMDVDEFYRKNEFKQAKEYIFKNKITHSACSIYDYRILPIYRMRETRDYCVSFIFKLSFLSIIIGSRKWNNMPCHMDSFRTFPFIPLIHKFYYLNNVSMHHMTGVRNDYECKLRNTLSNFSVDGRQAIIKYRELQNKMEKMSEEQILKEGYIKVKDEFGILEEWKNKKV